MSRLGDQARGCARATGLTVRGLGRAALVAACAGGAAAPGGIEAQVTRSIPPPGVETHTAVPGDKYDVGGFRRWLLGAGYRDIWRLPIEIPVLDLDFAGGLTPFEEGGYGQTRSVKFLGADGLQYAVRSIDKDPTRRLDSIFQGTIVATIVRDQVAQFLPTAALVADPLLEAAGVLHPKHRLVVVPDDPRLGPFREDYAGLIGMLTDQPQEAPGNEPGFAGSRRVSGSENFLEELEEGDCNRVNARGYLKARLMDIVLGDRDRHAGQFRWARFPDGPDCFRWEVVPEDRDQAFVINDGLVATMYRLFEPSQTRFGPDFPGIVGMTFTGWELDRRILPGLDEPVWREVAEEVRVALTDAVIEEAVGRLPASHFELRGAFLIESLEARRDRLDEATLDFYELISDQVEIRATDREEDAVFEHLPNGDMRLTIAYREGPGSDAPYFDRTFRRGTTREVRLHLQGGDDSVRVTGGEARIKTRAIGGGGDDVYVNESLASARNTRFYDHRGDNTFQGAARVDERDFDRPPSNNRVHQYALDWGGLMRVLPNLEYDSDIGVYASATVGFQRFGFRKVPYASDNAFTVGYGSLGNEFLVGWLGHYRDAIGGADLRLDAEYSGLDVLRFTGFGNATRFLDDDGSGDTEGDSRFFQVEHEQFAFRPTLEWHWGLYDRDSDRERHARSFLPELTLGIGPVVRFSNAPADANADRFLGTIDPVPIGVGAFGQIGARASLRYDTRDSPAFPTRGARFEAGVSGYPELWDVEDAYGEVHGSLSVYLTPGANPMNPTLALRAGGQHVTGDFPFFDAAFLGGSRNVRGLRSERYAGQSALFANAEARIPLLQFEILFPAEMGLLGSVDVGRVFFEADPDDADSWHPGYGGGLWLSFLNRGQVFSATVVDGGDGMRLYLRAGLHF
ncbi:MAG: BamA/TamA family outer membrane protein [Gemmatimonadetes bacterium]|nr:BamA/TamA family outer membrane protein [Gemmatimonadota bacterium]